MPADEICKAQCCKLATYYYMIIWLIYLRLGERADPFHIFLCQRQPWCRAEEMWFSRVDAAKWSVCDRIAAEGGTYYLRSTTVSLAVVEKVQLPRLSQRWPDEIWSMMWLTIEDVPSNVLLAWSTWVPRYSQAGRGSFESDCIPFDMTDYNAQSVWRRRDYPCWSSFEKGSLWFEYPSRKSCRL